MAEEEFAMARLAFYSLLFAFVFAAMVAFEQSAKQPDEPIQAGTVRAGG